MASIPTGGFNVSQAISFVANVGISYTLNNFLAPDGPRLKDLSVAGGDYGVVMPRVYGGGVRLPLPFLAQAPIKETKHSTDNTAGIVIGAVSGAAQGFAMGGPVGAAIGAVVGGLLGSKKHHYYTYSDTFAVLVADRSDDDPIEDVLALWANGRQLFGVREEGGAWLPGTSPVEEELDADGGLIYRKYGKNRYFKSLTIYGGGLEQVSDPILNATVGAQPGYRGSAYLVIEDLQLAVFGNSVPPIEALIQAKDGQQLIEVAEAMCAAAGIDTLRNVSTVALLGSAVRGYAVTEQVNCWEALSPLMPVFQKDAGDIDGQVRFYSREQGLRATIGLQQMGAHIYGEEAPDRISYTRGRDLALPRETSLTFIDPGRNHQPNTATSRRSEGDARSNVATKLAITLTAEEGAKAVSVLHWDAWLGRTAVTTTLTDGWTGLTPGICYGIPFADDVLPYRLTRKARGANGIIEAEFISAENVVTQGVYFGAEAELPGDDDTEMPTTRAVLIDMPILQDLHDDFGFYAVLGSNKAYWTQGRLELSPDGGTTWGTLVDGDEVTVVGDVTGTLPPGPTTGLDDTLDTTTVLTVVLMHDALVLESATDAELDAWANLAYVGKGGQGEYLQFKTATKVGTATWELSDLRRGRRGTDWAMDAHVEDEEFALLSDGAVYRMPYVNGDSWGAEYDYRAVTLHQDEDDAAVQAFTNSGEGKKPFSPTDLQGSFDGSGDLTLTWERRARFFSGDLGTDAPEAYEVDIVLDGLVVRTIDTSVEEASYSAGDQATDGFAAEDPIVVEVYQVNTDYGRGHVRRAAFLNPAVLLTLEDDTTPMLMEDDFTPIALG